MLRVAGCVWKLMRTCPNEHFRSVFNSKTYKLLPDTQDIKPYQHLGILCGNMRSLGIGSTGFLDRQTFPVKHFPVWTREERRGSRSFSLPKFHLVAFIRPVSQPRIWLHRYSSTPRPREVWANSEIEHQRAIPNELASVSMEMTPVKHDIFAGKQQRELRIVNVAVAVNVAILLAKVGTWAVTSSGALLAEALHSLADIVNQLLLRAGVQQSRRAPTRQHPYGFHREKYIYALMSAVGVFCVGAGASVVHGIQSLVAPPALEHMGYSIAVLGISAFAEMFSLTVAFRALRNSALEQNQGLWKYMMSSRDPTTSAVLAEDAGAVLGLGIAGTASYMSWTTGAPVYDAVGSIAVGILMGAVAVTLIRNNKRFLIGQAMRPDMLATIVAHLKADPMVLSVIDPKSEEIGDGIYRFKAEIQWSGDRVVHKYLGSLGRESLYGQIRQTACESPDIRSDTIRDAMDMAMMEFGRGVIRTVGEEIDRLEAELRTICPGLVYVDLETDRGRTESSALECLIQDEPPQSIPTTDNK